MERGSPVAMLLILAGLPGVGKSTLARALAARLGGVWLRVNSIERTLAESGPRIPPAADAGYRAAYAVAADNLDLGRIVVTDSVNPVEESRAAWRTVARLPTWAAVRQRDYRPWTRERIVIDTAHRSTETCVAAILVALPSPA